MATTTKKIKAAKVPALQVLLSYRRAHNSLGERQYIMDFIQPLKPHVITTDKGEVMAFIVYVGKSNIMFTSHTDTVYMSSDVKRQVVLLKENLYCKEDNQPLGADDAAGNWLMFNMIHARVPGIYAFFRGEERGGIGSSYCAKHVPDLFQGVDCAIALDRRGYNSIITHQGMGRGCSDEFGLSLARVINLGYELDKTGIYTDTAEFFNLVPNCTNVSVGYDREHSKMETLDKFHIERLRDSLLAADWSQLDFTPPVPDVSVKSSLFGRLSIQDDADDTDDVVALEVADFVFDYCDRLPKDLRDEALALAQKIYKRFE